MISTNSVSREFRRETSIVCLVDSSLYSRSLAASFLLATAPVSSSNKAKNACSLAARGPSPITSRSLPRKIEVTVPARGPIAPLLCHLFPESSIPVCAPLERQYPEGARNSCHLSIDAAFSIGPPRPPHWLPRGARRRPTPPT